MKDVIMLFFMIALIIEAVIIVKQAKIIDRLKQANHEISQHYCASADTCEERKENDI
jgi:hypothetical protein